VDLNGAQSAPAIAFLVLQLFTQLSIGLMIRSGRLSFVPVLATALTAAVWLTGGLSGSSVPQEQNERLPDTSAFLRHVHERLDQVWPPPVDASYCVRWLDRGDADAPRRWIYEVRPAPPHLDMPPYWRLLFDGNKTVTEARLAREDRQRARRITEEEQRRKAESPSARARHDRAAAERRERMNTDIDDLFRNFDIRLEERVPINGRSAIALSLTPRQRASLRGRYADIFRHARARAWVDEQEHELVRVEGELTGDVLFALGVLARVHRGTGGVFIRERLDNGRWVPVEAQLTGSVRRLLLDVKQLDMHVQFFGYAFGQARPAANCLATGMG
jgi:hypothetical protein